MEISMFILAIWVTIANILCVLAVALICIKKVDKSMIPFTILFIIPSLLLGIATIVRGV